VAKGSYDQIFKPAADLPFLERIRRLSWREFEALLADSYRGHGFHVEEKGGPKPDGGYDLVLLKENQLLLVQCKHWLVFQVGVPKVRELLGAVHKVNATGGILVTCGDFTSQAREFANGTPIELIDGAALAAWISAKPIGTAEAVSETAATPSCPKCRRPMVSRVAKRGRQPGKRFWGCPDYPRCRGIVQAA
jgi:restriction system protein